MKCHSFIENGGLSSKIIIENISHENPYDFTQLHRHNYFEIFLFKQGNQGSQVIDFVEYPILSKNLYIIAPNQVHLMQRKKNEDGIVIQFSKSFLQNSIYPFQLDWLYKIRTTPQTALLDEQFELLYHAFGELQQIQYSNHIYKTEQIRHYFAYIIFQMLGAFPKSITKEKEDGISYQFMDMVEKNFRNFRKIGAYAKHLNISVNSLNRKIKKRFGKTPLEIIHDLLLVEIKRLLIVEQLSNKEISFMLNFDSQSSYSRFVRKHTGYSPSNLRINFEQQ